MLSVNIISDPIASSITSILLCAIQPADDRNSQRTCTNSATTRATSHTVNSMTNEERIDTERTEPNAPTATPTAANDDVTSLNTWHPYPERIQRMWLLSEALQCVFWSAVCVIAAVICWFNHWWNWQPIVIGVFAAINLLDFASQPLQTKYRYSFGRFLIGERFLRVRKGWLFRSTTTIPYNRVQHVDVKQGPLLHKFDLTTIVIHTASDAHEIESLDSAEAERMTALITERVAAAKEDL